MHFTRWLIKYLTIFPHNTEILYTSFICKLNYWSRKCGLHFSAEYDMIFFRIFDSRFHETAGKESSHMLKAETAPANFTTTIYQYLWHEISTLKLLPGTKLSEAKLARKFNCSRVPVREAVHLLVKEGALEARPKIGSFVTYIDLEHLERIRYLREALECKIILEGCKKNLFDPIIPYLDDLIARQRAYINASAFELAFQLDTEFHRIFYNLTHKEFVLSHTGESDIHYLRARLVALRYDDPTALPLQHQAIVDALVTHDEKGLQEAILLHLNNINVTYATRLPDSEKWMFTNGEFV